MPCSGFRKKLSVSNRRHPPRLASATKGLGGARDAPGRKVEEGCGQSTSHCAPHIQEPRRPPDKKIARAAVINTRSNCALSRLKSTTETKSTASTRSRVTLVIVVIN